MIARLVILTVFVFAACSKAPPVVREGAPDPVSILKSIETRLPDGGVSMIVIRVPVKRP